MNCPRTTAVYFGPVSLVPPSTPFRKQRKPAWEEYRRRTRMLPAVLGYVARGWPVLPCKPGGKEPLTAHGSKDATTNEATICSWWARWPDANIGIATGSASGLLVVDIDPRNGSNEQLAELEKRHGELSTDYVVGTSDGGRHYYFRLPNGEAVPCSKLAPGIDIKGDGGYVIAPPSIHPSGHAYCLKHEGYVPPAPDWLIAELRPKANAQAHAQGGATVGVDGLHVSSEIKRLIREGKPKGQRSEAIFKVIRAMVKAGHADTEISTILLDPANKLSEKPLEHGPAWLQAEINRARVKPDTEGQAANGKDASSTGKQNRPSAGVVCLADVEPEEVEWLWHPYIPIGKVTSIEGDPGLGKSWLLMAIAAAISKGGEGLLGKPAAAPATCLLISAEDGLADTIRPRLDGLGADVKRIHALDQTPIADEKGVALLEKHIGELHPALVVIDPLVAYMGGKIDMNKANQTRQIMAGLAQLAEKYRCAIVVLRHLSKGGQDKAIYRGIGSIDITAACRSVLLVAVDPNDGSRRVVAHIKSNLAANGQAIGFAIVDGDFQWHGYVDVTPEQMLAPDSAQNERRSALKEAEEFLCAALENGQRLATEICELANQNGISESTLKRAKRKLKIESHKEGDIWFWILPPKGTSA